VVKWEYTLSLCKILEVSMSENEKNGHVIYLFIYFFDMFTQEGVGRIRTSDLRFIRRGPNRLSYLLRGDNGHVIIYTYTWKYA
jgi:hypothetical protein